MRIRISRAIKPQMALRIVQRATTCGPFIDKAAIFSTILSTNASTAQSSDIFIWITAKTQARILLRASEITGALARLVSAVFL